MKQVEFENSGKLALSKFKEAYINTVEDQHLNLEECLAIFDEAMGLDVGKILTREQFLKGFEIHQSKIDDFVAKKREDDTHGLLYSRVMYQLEDT